MNTIKAIMRNYIFTILTLFFLAFVVGCFSSETKDTQTEKQTVSLQKMPESVKSDSIQQILTKVVNDGKAPGMIAAIICGDSIIAIASAGERKAGSGIEFTINDVVHLGSCTKAMTATMIATLVAEGKLSWDTKLIEVFPELRNKIHTDYHNITLWQLLTHRAGIPKNPSNLVALRLKEIKKSRLSLLEDNLISPITYEIDKFEYSNFGYIIAACMAEQITGSSWEDLIKKRLFDPLGMSTAGFGNPNKNNVTDQPWGHNKFVGKWRPSEDYYNKAIGPAGRVHCSINDWAKFLSLQLKGENSILEREHLDRLIEPVGYYAAGWFVGKHEWINEKTLVHGGTNGIWYTEVIVSPKYDRAFIVATNSCDEASTPKICNDILKKLVAMELDSDCD